MATRQKAAMCAPCGERHNVYPRKTVFRGPYETHGTGATASVSRVNAEVLRYADRHPEMSVFFDGDTGCVIGVPLPPGAYA